MDGTEHARLGPMLPTLAQVLNTLAHELRTPVAVSQGYLKLYLEGRLQSPEDQRKALQQTADAVARLSGLCSEVGAVAALAESPGTPVREKVPVELLLKDLRAAAELEKVTWTGDLTPTQVIEATSRRDLSRAFSLIARAAVDDARGRPVKIEVVSDGAAGLRVHAGVEPGITALASGPDGDGATPFDLVRGGRGLSLIWATFVLNQNHVHTWQHSAEKAAVGFQFRSSQA
ncbi:MAG: histidine kinase dimerization/phospho-acceptor domain-containing protein [Vicinamibacterales bacterium]